MMKVTPNLSKSKFVAGCQCLRRLYWQINPPESFEVDDSANEAIFAQGHQVGEMARLAFPGGVLVHQGPWEHAQAVVRTQELMNDPNVPAIFEAAFTAERIKVRVDVLERRSGGRWRLIEVKQSTSVKDYQLLDVAIQKHVLHASGVKVNGSCLMYLNNAYVYDGRHYDLAQLFVIQNVSAPIKIISSSIPQRLELQWAALADELPPAVEPGSHCSDPYTCQFYDLCNVTMPVDHIRHLPRISPAKLEELEELGIESIAAIPQDFSLTTQQDRARRSHITQGIVKEPGIHDAIASLRYPLFFMDFETLALAIPVHPGTRPYQQVPFQWSVQVQDSPHARLKPCAFLAEDASDPREPFLRQLLDLLESGDGHIVVYNQAFEETRLTELADRFPETKKRVERLRGRLWDLLPVIRNHVYHPEFYGSFSIKRVLPALIPGMSYDEMEVGDGNQAGLAFQRMIDPELPPALRRKLRMALLEYCAQDTKAMYEVLRIVSDVAPHVVASPILQGTGE